MLAEIQKASVSLETQRVKRAQGGVSKGWVDPSRLGSCRRSADGSHQSWEEARAMRRRRDPTQRTESTRSR